MFVRASVQALFLRPFGSVARDQGCDAMSSFDFICYSAFGDFPVGLHRIALTLLWQ